jgi:Thiol-disulfide isomerase and thioredoxins
MKKSIVNAVKWMIPGILFFMSATPTGSQNLRKLSVVLTINENESGFANFPIDLDQKVSNTSRQGKAQGGVLVSADRLTDPPDAYHLRVDSAGDGDLANDPTLLLLPNTSVVVRVVRRWANGEKRDLPYTIHYSREPDRNNNIRERFYWSPHYRADGRVKVGKCESLLVALDLNGDGLFDQADFAQGTSIGLDRNGDGRIMGKAEWLSGNEIVEYCGSSFLITAISANGTNVTLADTPLRVPKLGAEIPEFSLKTTTGQTLNLRGLKGKMHLLDFWASWCKPCVEKFSLVKQLGAEYGEELAIIAVNVDEEPRLAMARDIVRNYGLRWPQVMSGQGEADPLWKSFGGMEGNRLAIPLYVLVDSKGVLRYAGNGGEGLAELRSKVEEAKKAH